MSAALAACRNEPATPLPKLVRTVALPGVEGRLGHLLWDRLRGRLYVAAPENHSIEILDVESGSVWRSHRDVGDPQAFAFVSGATAREDLVVASLGASGKLWVGNAESGERHLTVDAGSPVHGIRYHDATARIFAGRGDPSGGTSGGIAAFDVVRFERVGDVDLGAIPAGFQLESFGARLFVNLPDAAAIAVVARETRTVESRFTLRNVKGNDPMALDERMGRLFAGCHTPPSLIAIDARKGEFLGSYPCGKDAGDVHCDFAKGAVYVSCGEGTLDVFEHRRPDTYERTGRLETREGARTSCFSPTDRRLFVALPKRGDGAAEVRVYELP